MPQQLGLPRLPITGTWAAPFTLYYLVLSSRVLFERLRSEVFVGDYAAASAATATATANNSPTAPTAASGPGLVTLRGIHSNFNENVPLGFILCALAEANGASRSRLSYAMGLLLVLRVCHADLGLMRTGKWGNNAVGRPIGFFGSSAWLAAMSVYSAYLVKGYWGLT